LDPYWVDRPLKTTRDQSRITFSRILAPYIFNSSNSRGQYFLAAAFHSAAGRHWIKAHKNSEISEMAL
jgi:hypothetical protein